MEATTIALIGFVSGVFSNPIPIVGGTIFNIIVTSLLLAYQQLAQTINSLPMLPLGIFVFAIAFSIGVLAIKVLSLLPLPYISQLAQGLRGGN